MLAKSPPARSDSPILAPRSTHGLERSTSMSDLRVDAVVLLGDQAGLIRYPTDEIWLRAVGHGDIQVADYRSEDRHGPPAHSHPWDEAQIVVEGEAEFRIGDGDWIRGGSGSVQLLPKGVPHT